MLIKLVSELTPAGYDEVIISHESIEAAIALAHEWYGYQYYYVCTL